MSEKLTVLKIGGSVLVDEADVRRAVHEIYRFHREGDRVVAVISAFHGATDRLLKLGSTQGKSEPELATLLASGERSAAKALADALVASGVPVALLDPEAIELETRGPRFDADPIAVARAPFLRAFEDGCVVVVPGFFGRSEEGGIALLGRGGSDLTALFLASELGASRCRLIKDVPALFEWDPALAGQRPRAFARATFATAELIGGRVLQKKAVAFARGREQTFELGDWNCVSPTILGGSHDRFRAESPRPPIGVALLGCGVVNSAVRRELDALSDRLALRRVLVRDLRGRGPDTLLTAEPSAVLESCTGDGQKIDVCVEAIGGEHPALDLALEAIDRGVAFVSANKSLHARHGERLAAAAAGSAVSLFHSACVGGSVPILETALRLRGTVRRFVGVLNGTSAFVAHELAHGRPLLAALERARREGLAELDATRDLDGTDSAEKLVLIARALGHDRITFDSIHRDCENFDERAAAARRSGRRLVQLATLDLSTDDTTHPGSRSRRVGTVEWRAVDPSSAFLLDPSSGISLEAELRPKPIVTARFVLRDGPPVTVRGLGAGGRPTALSVVADLLEFARAVESGAPSRVRVDDPRVTDSSRMGVHVSAAGELGDREVGRSRPEADLDAAVRR